MLFLLASPRCAVRHCAVRPSGYDAVANLTGFRLEPIELEAIELSVASTILVGAQRRFSTTDRPSVAQTCCDNGIGAYK